MVYCEECGIVPEKKENLPILLPTDVEFTGKGESPLTTSKTFMNTTCPCCGGTGKISSSILVDEAIERQISYIVQEKGVKAFTLIVNPLVEAYVTKGLFNSIEKRWEKKHKCSIKIEANANLPLLSFEFLDKKGEKIDASK